MILDRELGGCVFVSNKYSYLRNTFRSSLGNLMLMSKVIFGVMSLPYQVVRRLWGDGNVKRHDSLMSYNFRVYVGGEG